MSQRFRVDRDIFENALLVEANLFCTYIERCVFKKIRIRVDVALALTCTVHGYQEQKLMRISLISKLKALSPYK